MACKNTQTNSNIKVVALLVGVPASGKTTFTHNFRQYLKSVDSNLDLICVEFDTFLPRDTRCSDTSSADATFQWRKHRDNMKLQIQTLLDTQDKGLSSEDRLSVLILDDTFHYRSMRYEYYRLSRQKGLRYVQLFFKISLEESLLRNKLREHKVPEGTIYNIWEHIVSPIGSVLEWEQNTIVIDTLSEIPFQLIATKLTEVSTHPLTPVDDTKWKLIEKEVSRKETLSSLSHQSDVILRKVVGAMIRAANQSGMEKEEIISYAERCNGKRKEILKELTEGKWSKEVTELNLEDFLKQLMSEVKI